MKTLTCIIPTFNEAARIETVLKAITLHPLISETIIVDDGSTDATLDIIKKYTATDPHIRLIVHEKNQGKSKAIYDGFMASTDEYILFLDADLIGLTALNVTTLIEPVIEGRADISISLRMNAPWPWRPLGIDYISGERVFAKSLLTPYIAQTLTLRKFGVEVFFNRIIINNKLRIEIVPWNNVVSPFKIAKVGIKKGILGECHMMIDIFRTISPFEALMQIIHMMRLRV